MNLDLWRELARPRNHELVWLLVGLLVGLFVITYDVIVNWRAYRKGARDLSHELFPPEGDHPAGAVVAVPCARLGCERRMVAIDESRRSQPLDAAVVMRIYSVTPSGSCAMRTVTAGELQQLVREGRTPRFGDAPFGPPTERRWLPAARPV